MDVSISSGQWSRNKSGTKQLDQVDDDVDNKVERSLNRRKDRVKSKISEVDIPKQNSFISELTLPNALRRAPPPHARVRANKPRNRSGQLPSHKEDKDGEVSVEQHLGPMTGNDIDVMSNTAKTPISALTMPAALHPMFAQALKSYKKQQQMTPTEQVRAQRQKSSSGGVPSPPERPSPRTMKEVPPPPRRNLPPPPIRPNRGQTLPTVASNDSEILLEDAAAQLMSMQHQNGGSRQPPPPPPPLPRSSSASNVKSLSSSTSRMNNATEKFQRVENMPYSDEFQDTGMYSGETNEYGQPHGWGRFLCHDTGVVFEGRWTNGARDGDAPFYMG